MFTNIAYFVKIQSIREAGEDDEAGEGNRTEEEAVDIGGQVEFVPVTDALSHEVAVVTEALTADIAGLAVVAGVVHPDPALAAG